MSITGTNHNDTLVGTNANDTISGGNGDDAISGGGGADTLSGDNGNDTIDGGAGNDTVSGGNGNDVLNGGSGSDVVNGDNGNDTAIYVAVDNLNAHDVYDGGNGTDTLVLKLTQSQLNAMNATMVFADFRAAAGGTFDFSHYQFGFAMNLTARSFEQIRTVVIADPAPPVAAADANAITEDGPSSAIAGNVLANDTLGGIADATLSVTDTGVLTGLYGTLTLNADGTYTYVLDQTNAAVNALNNGDTLQETFSYTVTDGYGHATSQLAITINGHTDIAPLFTDGDDVVDFNTVVAGTYVNGSQFDALGGNDTIILPANATEAAQAGYIVGIPFRTGGGNNTVVGGALGDVVIGGAGADTIDGGAGNDTLFGGAGDDLLTGGSGEDRLDGGDGNDTFFGSGDNVDHIDGGAGVNRVDYTNSNIGMDIRLDIDAARKGFGPNTTGFDFLTNIQDAVGSRFADVITGGSDNNALFGGDGDDFIDGGAGNDRLDGGNGRDILFGGAGDDVFVSDGINNVIRGDDGNDTIDYSGVVFDLAIQFRDGFGGEAPLRTIYPIDYPFLPDGFSGIENVIGGQGNDFIIGDSADNRISGYLGNDTLGGQGGRDIFHFDLSGGANVGNDIIGDFEIGIDHISLAGGLYHDVAELNPHQVGSHTVLDLGAGMQLTLWFTNASLLTNNDFIFA